jgi:hypothetical protein
MSKQDIEKRLGFAAQGVKETTRTSAKAAFASPKYRAFVYRGSPSNNVAVKATEWMDSASAAEDAAKQIVMSFRGKPGYNSNNYFADIAQETPEGAKTVKNNIRFSRPGAKATFDTKVGSKGNKSAMIAKNGPDADASWLAWVVQHHGDYGQGERVLGTMRSYSTEARAKAAALRGLETSGLRGGFARPGVKAKMGRPKTVTVITMMSGTGESRGLFKVVGYDENGREFEYGMFAMRSMAEQKAKDVARWTDSKYISSRPGVKAKA